MRRARVWGAWLVMLAAAGGCAGAPTQPRNELRHERVEPADELARYARRETLRAFPGDTREPTAELGRMMCRQPFTPASPNPGPAAEDAPPISAGDVVRLHVVMGEEISGDYEVDGDGRLRAPFLKPIPAAGVDLETLQERLTQRLVEDGLFRPGFAKVDAAIVERAPAAVSVTGAVRLPGMAIVGERRADARLGSLTEAGGDAPPSGRVSDALQAAGGVRPDADIQNIVLERQGERRLLNMAGAITGARMENPYLVGGDQIYVASLGCEQEALVRPSAITPPGIRVFMSNLTQPASSNAQSAIGRDTVSLPYGVRMLQGLIAANCVGGTQLTSANRHAVLITRDWATGESLVVQRPVEALVRNADRDDYNPFLYEGDAIACYDSRFTNVRDVVRSFGDVLSPFIFLRGLLRD